jgi:Domain of unknown function (DUF3885)
MQDAQLENLFTILVEKWPSNALNQYPLTFGDISLRFELGNGLRNSTEPRVVQAAHRAATLFEHTFAANDELFVITQDFRTTPDVKNSALPHYIHNFRQRTIASRVIPPVDPEEEVLMEVAAFRCKRQDINASPLFRAIANREMNFDPTLDVVVYFLKPDSDVVFFMYDDRGCLIYANQKSVLQPLYDEHHAWLVHD